MKTYTITKKIKETAPLLTISRDYEANNPLPGYIIKVNGDYSLHYELKEQYKIIKAVDNARKNGNISPKQFGEFVKEEYEKITRDRVLKIYPVKKYTENGIRYKIVDFDNTDISHLFIVTSLKVLEFYNVVDGFEQKIDKALEKFNHYINGEVYSYNLYNEKGKLIKYGYSYGIEEIRKELPQEWQSENLDEYITD